MITQQKTSFPKAALREIAGLVVGAERSSLDSSVLEEPFNIIIDTIEGIDDLSIRSQIVTDMCRSNSIDPILFHKALATEDVDSNKFYWPSPLAEDAFYGPIGALVRSISPHTEADEAGILISMLVALVMLLIAAHIFGVAECIIQMNI